MRLYRRKLPVYTDFFLSIFAILKIVIMILKFYSKLIHRNYYLEKIYKYSVNKIYPTSWLNYTLFTDLLD